MTRGKGRGGSGRRGFETRFDDLIGAMKKGADPLTVDNETIKDQCTRFLATTLGELTEPEWQRVRNHGLRAAEVHGLAAKRLTLAEGKERSTLDKETTAIVGFLMADSCDINLLRHKICSGYLPPDLAKTNVPAVKQVIEESWEQVRSRSR